LSLTQGIVARALSLGVAFMGPVYYLLPVIFLCHPHFSWLNKTHTLRVNKKSGLRNPFMRRRAAPLTILEPSAARLQQHSFHRFFPLALWPTTVNSFSLSLSHGPNFFTIYEKKETNKN
jgi:hypothetical protein